MANNTNRYAFFNYANGKTESVEAKDEDSAWRKAIEMWGGDFGPVPSGRDGMKATHSANDPRRIM